MHSLLNVSRTVGRYITHHLVENKKTKISDEKRDFQGHVVNKRIRVVCKACNNGWMSRLEEDAKPILTPLILGSSGILDAEMQLTLSRWIMLKVMVGEFNKRDEVVLSNEQRRTFMVDQMIPTQVRIGIARCESSFWQFAYCRCSAQVALVKLGGQVVLPTEEKKNIQTTAIGIGKLFVYATVSNAERLDLGTILKTECLTPIWPLPGEHIKIPLDKELAHSDANSTSIALNSFLGQAGIYHADISQKRQSDIPPKMS